MSEAVFWLAPLPLLVRWLVPPRVRVQPAVRVPFLSRLQAAGGGSSREAAHRFGIPILVRGLVWLLLLTAGAFGNLANAWLQNPAHRAVGASTAIFGAVGMLATISMVRYRHNLRPRRRWTLPVAAALGLLAMLGAGGENTDLGAHLFGFLFGLPLGFGAELLIEKRGRPGRTWNALLALVAVALVTGAWWSALQWGP